jgi:hypothetical protein
MAPCPLPINCLMLKIAEPEWPPALPCPLPQTDESEPLPIWWPACIAMSNPNLDPNPTTYDQGASRSGMSLERRDVTWFDVQSLHCEQDSKRSFARLSFEY